MQTRQSSNKHKRGASTRIYAVIETANNYENGNYLEYLDYPHTFESIAECRNEALPSDGSNRERSTID